MSLRAGRVGVAPSQVDEFGVIKGGSGPSGDSYTKQEADAKFETKDNATSTYETKADAANLQPKTITVPTHMLGGTQLTVEASLTAAGTALGTLQFRDNSGTPQVKVPGGSWEDFNGGGTEVLGFNIPADKLITTGINTRSTGTLHSGGYYIDPSTNIMYVDLVYSDTATSASNSFIEFLNVNADLDVTGTGYATLGSDFISANSGSPGFYLHKPGSVLSIGKSSVGITPANTQVHMYGQVKLKSS